MLWSNPPFPKPDAYEIERALGCGPVIATLLGRLGLDTEQARRFLHPRLADLEDPFAIHGMDRAVDRLIAASAAGQSIAILGDYDVDGVTSTALLAHVLRRLGSQPRYYVPRRLEEGYGLSRGAIDRLLEDGCPGLFIALDCGTNSTEEVAFLRSRGADVLILDHHRSKGELPADATLVNPHTSPGELAAGRTLCTVGLVFKLAHGLLKRLRADGDGEASQVRLRDYLDLVALGTIADLVPLRGENRILTKFGLEILQAGTRPGLRALMDIAGIDRSHSLRPVDISFRLGPRINASGRLADAALAVDLLLSEDPAFCEEAAAQLDHWNRERQELERQIVAMVDERVADALPDASGLVVYGEEWHPGVVGIVASRVSKKYYRPSIVLGTDGDLAKGSGRSVAGLNLVEVLSSCDRFLENWGGHPMAVGISLRKENVAAFQQAFDAAVRLALAGAALEPELAIGAWLNPEDINEDFMRELDQLHPFGEGNREPVFALRGVVLRQAPEVFREHHFRFQFSVGSRRLHGVAWKMADQLPPLNQPIDLAVFLKWNYYNGRQLLQLELVHWRHTQVPAET